MCKECRDLGFIELLTLLFVGLKLTGVIKWSWLWVLSPIWISFLLVLVIAAVIVVIAELHDFK